MECLCITGLFHEGVFSLCLCSMWIYRAKKPSAYCRDGVKQYAASDIIGIALSKSYPFDMDSRYPVYCSAPCLAYCCPHIPYGQCDDLVTTWSQVFPQSVTHSRLAKCGYFAPSPEPESQFKSIRTAELPCGIGHSCWRAGF